MKKYVKPETTIIKTEKVMLLTGSKVDEEDNVEVLLDNESIWDYKISAD